MMFRTLLICLSLLCLAHMGQAADHLLYFEAQGIAGYSSELNKAIFYSMNPDAEMQKPSLGFDYIQAIFRRIRRCGHLCPSGPSGPDRGCGK